MNRDWFDINDSDIKGLLEERNKLHAATLNGEGGACRDHADAYRLQKPAGIYSTLQAAYGPMQRAPFLVRSWDDETLVTGKEGTLKRWTEYYARLSNGKK